MQENLDRLETGLAIALRGLDARGTQLTPHGNPAKWTIQQIVEHLLLSYQSTVSLVQARLEKGTPTKATPSVRQRVGQFGVLNLGYLPNGAQAPAAVIPAPPKLHLNSEELMRRVHEELQCLHGALAQAESIFGKRQFASHIILGPLSATQWARFHQVHGEHHAKQIRRIRSAHQA